MAKRKYPCRFFTKPRAILERRDIPKDSPIWWRYDRLLVKSYEETLTQYGDIRMSNAELAALWECNEEAARKGLTEMREFGLIKTRQEGRTGRTIQLVFAWRGQGKDSVPEPDPAMDRRLSDETRNAPEPHALQREAPPTATGVPARTDDRGNGHEPAPRIMEGGKQTTTLDPVPNIVVVDSSTPSLQESSTTTTNYARTREAIYRIADALEDLGLITDEVVEEALALEHVTPEFVEDWTLHKRIAGQKLTGGYYRMQIREKRESPYTMSKSQRIAYRSDKDAEWRKSKDESR